MPWKNPDSLVFYVNDTRTKNYPRIKTDHEDSFHSRIKVLSATRHATGRQLVGAVNPDELPVEIYVDWVLYYEPKGN